MPALVTLMASGFLEDERFDLAVLFGRIAFPYILFISLAALLSGVLNAAGRFAAAAAAPVLLNIGFIGALALGEWLGWPIGMTLSWTVPLAGIAQLALLWIAARRAGFALMPRRPRMTPELKRLAIIAGPAALAGGVVQVNLLVGRQVASFFDGAIAWLSYADRLYQLPLGVVGVAIGVVLLPDLSRRLRARDTAGGRNAFNRAAEFCLALTLPAAVALAVIPRELVSVLFQRGAFDAADSAATALAVAIYGLGLPAFVLLKTLQPLFFAREDTRSPLNYALAALIINAVLAVALSPVIGFLAAAVGAVAAGWGQCLLLWRGSRAMGEASALDDRLRARAPRIIAASLVMGAGLWIGAQLLSGWFATGGLRYAALAILVLGGMALYAAASVALGAFTPRDLKGALRR